MGLVNVVRIILPESEAIRPDEQKGVMKQSNGSDYLVATVCSRRTKRDLRKLLMVTGHISGKCPASVKHS